MRRRVRESATSSAGASGAGGSAATRRARPGTPRSTGQLPAVNENKPKPKPHPYHALTDGERAARNTLVKERRVARRNGGWSKVDKSHLAHAVEAKQEIKAQMKRIAKSAETDGWKKNQRQVRYDYLKKLVTS